MSAARECKHIKKLREYLAFAQLTISGELTEEPRGWVNVYCDRCKTTYEVSLNVENGGK